MQQITPIEIRQKSFEKSFRGYNSDEVDAFLHSLAYAWEKLTAQVSDLNSQLETSKKETQRLQEVENALLRTIKDSEVTARNIIEQAKREAEIKSREVEREVEIKSREVDRMVELKVKEAEIKAERILHEAQEKARIVEEENQQGQVRLQTQREKELERIRKTTQETESYRDSLLEQLQHIAEDILTKSQLIKRDIKIDQSNSEESSKAPEPPSSNIALEVAPVAEK